MRSKQDLEAYLLRSGLPHETVDEGVWLVRDPSSGERIVVALQGDLVVFRVDVVRLERIDPAQREALFRWLLERNATEMVHGAYGLQDDTVVMTFTLRLENFDYSEFVGTIEDFSLALAMHLPQLKRFLRKEKAT